MCWCQNGDDVNEYTLSCPFKVTSSSTCDDPSTIKEVVASIEAQTEGAKRFAKYSSGFCLKKIDFSKDLIKKMEAFGVLSAIVKISMLIFQIKI